ncbi:MAG: alpha/beta fold hydrolase, partial [Sphingobacteriales bacterium]
AHSIAAEGFAMVKFNFSHNGTSIQQPETFDNLEAFGQNNYSIQLTDLQRVIDWVSSAENHFAKDLDQQQIYLIGHSMGGGTAILTAANDSRIKKVVGWASVSHSTTPWGNWSMEKIAEWERAGVQYYENSRTGQQMPLYYQLYEDYQQNTEKLDIINAISSLRIPILLCHGSEDQAVLIEKAYELKDHQPSADLFTVNSDHVFGRKHPWTSDELPEAMQLVLDKTIQFLKTGC